MFMYLFTPLGLPSPAQTFQGIMDCVVSKLEAVFAYMDDSGVGSPNRQTHLIHLKVLFAALKSMVSPSTWGNVFLLFQLWKFLVTQSRWRVWPPQPDTLTRSILAPPHSGHQATAMFSQHDKYLVLLQNVLPQNVPPRNIQPQNVPPTKRPRLQNVPPTKRSRLQNVLIYKTSSSTKFPAFKRSSPTKRPRLQNVLPFVFPQNVLHQNVK